MESDEKSVIGKCIPNLSSVKCVLHAQLCLVVHPLVAPLLTGVTFFFVHGQCVQGTPFFQPHRGRPVRKSRPNRFALIKSKYAHCFHLPDKDGRVTYYERPGMSDIAELKRLGITKTELLDHYVYCMEFLWKVTR